MSPEKLSVYAFIVSLLALLASGSQSYFNYEHNRVSISPKLDYRVEANVPGHGVLEIKLVNVGLGPAVIKDISVVFDREPIGRAGFETCSRVKQLFGLENIENEDSYCWVLYEHEEIYVREDEHIIIYRIDTKNEEKPYIPGEEFKKLGLLVEYCGLYGDCWTLEP